MAGKGRHRGSWLGRDEKCLPYFFKLFKVMSLEALNTFYYFGTFTVT